MTYTTENVKIFTQFILLYSGGQTMSAQHPQFSLNVPSTRSLRTNEAPQMSNKGILDNAATDITESPGVYKYFKIYASIPYI